MQIDILESGTVRRVRFEDMKELDHENCPWGAVESHQL